MSDNLKAQIEKDPIAFIESLSPSNLRMLVSQLISHYFVMNFFGYSSTKLTFRHLPINKLKSLVSKSLTDDELIKFLDENFDIHYKDLLLLMSELTNSEEFQFIINIPDDDLRKIVLNTSPDTIVSAFNTVNSSSFDLFAQKIIGQKENFELPTGSRWIGIL